MHKGNLGRIVNSHTAPQETIDTAAELELKKHAELSSSRENCLSVYASWTRIAEKPDAEAQTDK